MKATNEQQEAAPKAPQPLRPVIDVDLARKVLDRDIINIVQRAKDGQPLTPQQRRLITTYAGILDRTEVLEALYTIQHGACPKCARLISQLIANIENA